MKRIAALCCAAALLLSLCACAGGQKNESPALYIEKAQLTAQEEAIAELLGEKADAHQIYDFVVDDTVQRLQTNIYRLEDGNWARTSGGDQAFTDTRGRIAFQFDRIADGVRIALQSEHSGGSTSYRSEPDESLPGSYATSILSDRTAIVYEEEIPLVLQVVTAKNEVVSYQTDYFFQPEELDALGYEGIYAITIRFSQTPLS